MITVRLGPAPCIDDLNSYCCHKLHIGRSLGVHLKALDKASVTIGSSHTLTIYRGVLEVMLIAEETARMNDHLH